MVVKTKTTLKVVSTRAKCVLIHLMLEKVTLYSLPWNRITILYFKRNNILQLRTSNNLLDYQLPCPHLTPGSPFFSIFFFVFLTYVHFLFRFVCLFVVVVVLLLFLYPLSSCFAGSFTCIFSITDFSQYLHPKSKYDCLYGY